MPSIDGDMGKIAPDHRFWKQFCHLLYIRPGVQSNDGSLFHFVLVTVEGFEMTCWGTVSQPGKFYSSVAGHLRAFRRLRGLGGCSSAACAAQATDLGHGRSLVESELRRRYGSSRSSRSESEQETHSCD